MANPAQDFPDPDYDLGNLAQNFPDPDYDLGIPAQDSPDPNFDLANPAQDLPNFTLDLPDPGQALARDFGQSEGRESRVNDLARNYSTPTCLAYQLRANHR